MAREVAESQGTHASNTPDPTNAWTAALAGLGVLEQPDSERVCHLWPDNLHAWQCWQGVQTQWRVGVGGATGLDYAGVRAYLDEQALPAEDRRSVFAGIQACERTTLEVWAEQRERNRPNPNAPPI